MNQQQNNQFQQDGQVPVQNRQTLIYEKETKNKFLTFVFALIPGAGQMYHGLYKRGVSLMVAFFGVIALATMLYTPPITLALPIIWFYSFFEAINRMNMSIDEMKTIKDEYFFNISFNSKGQFNSFFAKKHLIFGWVLVAVGVYALLNGLIISNYDFMHDYFQPYVYTAIYEISRMIPKLLIPIVCLVLGVKLINFKKIKSDFSHNSDENIQL